jgi:hypothetical protein
MARVETLASIFYRLVQLGFALAAVLLWSMPSSRSFAESTTNQPRKRCSCVSIRYPTI